MGVNVLTGHVVLNCPPTPTPKSLFLTLTVFVRSLISRKAYLLCLCTCEWQWGRCVKVTIWVKIGNVPVWGGGGRSSFYRLHPLPAIPTATQEIFMLFFHRPPKQRLFQWGVPGWRLDKSLRLWSLNRKRRSQTDSAGDTTFWPIRSMSAVRFMSNPFNLAIAYNYFSTHCCDKSTENGLIFTIWSISSDAAWLTFTSCCDAAFLMPLTILNNIDDEARQDKPPQAAGRIFFSFTAVVIAFPSREHEYKCRRVKPEGFIYIFSIIASCKMA